MLNLLNAWFFKGKYPKIYHSFFTVYKLRSSRFHTASVVPIAQDIAKAYALERATLGKISQLIQHSDNQY